MNNEVEELKQEYLDNVRLHIWYSDSPYSVHRGKASKELAARYIRLAHESFIKYCESRQ